MYSIQEPTPRPGRFKDIRGKKFGRMTVVHFLGVPPGNNQKALWLCRCDCGKERVLSTSALRTGNTRSCGCLKLEQTVARLTKHGFTSVPEFKVFLDILERCFNPNHCRYATWGGRGVTVDPQWNTADKFPAFFAEVGPRPSPRHQIDRIDNDGSYVAGNMRWVLPKEQSRNRRTNVYVNAFGEIMLLVEAREKYGLSWHYANKLPRVPKPVS